MDARIAPAFLADGSPLGVGGFEPPEAIPAVSGSARCRSGVTAYIAILPATVQHAAPLAANLRPGDRAEAEAVYDDVVGGFAWAIADSAEAWVATVAGEIIAAWGVVDEGSLLVPVGRPWCMTTPLVEQHRRHFARESRRIVGEWKQRYWRLHNCVDAGYEVSVRWCGWMGFTVGGAWPDERGKLWREFWWQSS